MAPRESSSRFAAVVMMPRPSGLLRTRKSPGWAPALAITCSGWTLPTTARPKIGSSDWIVWPPTIAMPASFALSPAPRRISTSTSGGNAPLGKPTMLRAASGVPAIA